MAAVELNGTEPVGVEDRIGAIATIENVGVPPRAAFEVIIAAPAGEKVVAAAALQLVVVAPTLELVVALIARQPVSPRGLTKRLPADLRDLRTHSVIP